MMRACHLREFGPVENLRVETISRPEPKPDEVLIRTHAFALNFPDMLMLQGKYQDRYPLPFIPGRDAAGVIDAVGSDVANYRRGDRVLCQVATGAWAEFIAAPVSRCFPMPAAATFEDAAALITPYHTAYVAIVSRSRIQDGEIAVVSGASGSVGSALIQFLKANGVFVVGLVSAAHKGGHVKGLGADAVVVVETAGDLKRTLPDQIRGVTGGRPTDVFFDLVGGDVFDAGLRSLGPDGRMIVIGFAGGRLPEVRANYLLLKNISVIGAPLDIHFNTDPTTVAAAAEHTRTLYDRASFRPTIKKVVPLDRLGEALMSMTDSSIPGRVVVTLG